MARKLGRSDPAISECCEELVEGHNLEEPQKSFDPVRLRRETEQEDEHHRQHVTVEDRKAGADQLLIVGETDGGAVRVIRHGAHIRIDQAAEHGDGEQDERRRCVRDGR
eukprot:CAMPEP_0180265072 /NCGR_PEP_ID=MMETSP0988-20121125/224_1 /TAXON_ID=697907 /ORGANISM="non described non described, Strain CCMP2293" /LENGTH=108 /DNA_ID=CAMNT_0022235467 /DNA_START=401 /DNA_END=723 /DNA_ORIENTATION=+